MTANELITLVSSRPWVLVAWFTAPPVLAILFHFIHGEGKGKEAAWRYFYAILVYLVCLPGMLSAVLTGYALFFTQHSLLEVNLLVYILPIVSMVATLILISRNIAFDAIPGFGRLSGLMVMIAMTFVIVLAISRTRIWLLFGGSIGTLVLLACGIFALLKWGAHMTFRGRDKPERKPPDLGL